VCACVCVRVCMRAVNLSVVGLGVVFFFPNVFCWISFTIAGDSLLN